VLGDRPAKYLINLALQHLLEHLCDFVQPAPHEVGVAIIELRKKRSQ
jgi:hypothetical protein